MWQSELKVKFVEPNDSRVLDVRFYYDLEQMHSMGTPFFKSLHVNVPLYTGARVKNEFFLSFGFR